MSLLVTLQLSFAQQQSLGAYHRQSVTILSIPALLHVPVNIAPQIGLDFTQKVIIPRFDINLVPANIVAQMQAQLPENPQKKDIEQTLNRVLLSSLVETLDTVARARAIEGLSEVEQNSWAVDKAKLDGVTNDDLQHIKNSAFILIPFARNYSYQKTDHFVGESHVMIGLLLYKVVVLDDTHFEIRAVDAISDVFSGSAGGLIWTQDAADQALLRIIDQNVTALVRRYPDFSLGGQIMEQNGSSVSVDIDERSGVQNDDYFDLIQLQSQGGEEYLGFGYINRIGNSQDNSFSSLRLVSGDPLTGVALRERVVAHQELYAGASFNNADGRLISGYMLGFGANIGSTLGINQLYFKTDVALPTKILFHVGLEKSVTLYRRLALSIQSGWMFNEATQSNGVYAGPGLQLAINPNWLMQCIILKLKCMCGGVLRSPTSTS